MSSNSLQSLEEKFRRVEEANERRALDKRDPLLREQLLDPLSQPRKHQKRRGVSVSQFGKQDELVEGAAHLGEPSSLSAAASKSTFYHTLANPRSVESFVSEKSENTRHSEERTEIQVERIAGRQTLPKTMGALLPRRLARAHSQLDHVPIDRNMVIDVSVETTTVSSDLSPNLQTSTAYAASRPRAATVGVPAPQLGLVGRAKDFARKLRRKSKT